MRDVIVFESGDKGVDVRVMLDGDTVWLSQAQMVELFGRSVSVISRHIANAIEDGEVSEKSNLQKMQIANSDKPVVFYDLDVIISVGYRVKSLRGVEFPKTTLSKATV
ncbi:MAG TPA: death-on-curing protein, partial [Thiotrichales bacterium]|nr:death-on-curing protein [Thiotrichales bacterium]